MADSIGCLPRDIFLLPSSWISVYTGSKVPISSQARQSVLDSFHLPLQIYPPYILTLFSAHRSMDSFIIWLGVDSVNELADIQTSEMSKARVLSFPVLVELLLQCAGYIKWPKDRTPVSWHSPQDSVFSFNQYFFHFFLQGKVRVESRLPLLPAPSEGTVPCGFPYTSSRFLLYRCFLFVFPACYSFSQPPFQLGVVRWFSFFQ